MALADEIVVGETERLYEPVLDDIVDDIEVRGEIDDARRVAMTEADGDIGRPELFGHAVSRTARATLSF